MCAIWNEMGMLNITEQRLDDQENNTSKKMTVGFRARKHTNKYRGYRKL